MTAEERFSLRAGCWGVIAGSVICEALTRAGLVTPAYWIVVAVSGLLAIGWVLDARSRAEPKAPDRPEGVPPGSIYVGEGQWIHRDHKRSQEIKDGIKE